jgi:hypothetical protein
VETRDAAHGRAILERLRAAGYAAGHGPVHG